MRNFVFIVLLGLGLNIHAKSIFSDPKGWFEDVKKSAKRDVDKVAHEAKRLVTEPGKVIGEVLDIAPELGHLSCELDNILADNMCKKSLKKIKKETADLKKFMKNHEKYMGDRNKDIAQLSVDNKDFASAVKDSIHFKVLLKKFNMGCNSINSVAQLNECIVLISSIENTAIDANSKISKDIEKIDVSRFTSIKEELQRSQKDIDFSAKCENSIKSLVQRIEVFSESIGEAKKHNNFFIITREFKNYKSISRRYSVIAKSCSAFKRRIRNINYLLQSNFDSLKSEILKEQSYFQYACLSITRSEENEFLYQSCKHKSSDSNFWFAYNTALLHEAKYEN